MILAAGLGTRLQPLTDERPKALVPVANKPAILWNIEYLKGFGATRLIVNTHHHHTQILDFLQEGRPFGIGIETRVEPEILGTGGGVKNTEDFWDDEPFVVTNSDVITNIPLDEAYEHHQKSGRIATLILHDHPPYNKIRVDTRGCIIEIPRAYDNKGLAFSGIHIIHPELLRHIPANGFSDIVDCYRQFIDADRPVGAYVAEGHYWYDIGGLDAYLLANRELAPEAFTLGPGTRVHPAARLDDWAVIGPGCEIGKHAVVARSVLWEGIALKEGERVADCVLTPRHAVCSAPAL